MRFAKARKNACAVNPGRAALESEAKLDRVPIKSRDPVKLTKLHRPATDEPELLHEIRNRRLSKKRHVSKHVMKNVGLFKIVKLAGLANEIACGKAPIGKMFKEDVVRHEPRNRDDLPTGARSQLLVKLGKIGNARTREVEDLNALFKFVDSAAVKQGLLPREQGVPHPMVLVCQLVPMLGHGPVGSRPWWRDWRSPGAVPIGRFLHLMRIVHPRVPFTKRKPARP